MNRAELKENERILRIENEKKQAEKIKLEKISLLSKGQYIEFSNTVYKRLEKEEFFLKKKEVLEEKLSQDCIRCQKKGVLNIIEGEEILCQDVECGLLVFKKNLYNLERGMSICYMDGFLKRLTKELYDLYFKRYQENTEIINPGFDQKYCERCKKPYILALCEVFEEKEESDDENPQETEYNTYICSDSTCALSSTTSILLNKK